MTARQTYEVHVNASASCIIRVRAESGSEALDIVQGQMKGRYGRWVIDFPGSPDEHFDVWRTADDTRVGPDGQGEFSEEG